MTALPALFSIIVVAIGALAMLAFLRQQFPRAVCVLTVVLLLIATPLLWLVVYEPNPRLATLFAVVAVLATFGDRWLRQGPTRSQIVSLVTLAGLFLALLVAPLFNSGVARSPATWSQRLFGALHGFLSWNPVAYVAVIGTIAFFSRAKLWATATLIALLLIALLPISEPSFAGGSFAPVIPLLAPGLATVIDAARRRPALAMLPLILVAVMWNNALMVQYTIGLVPKDAPVSFARVVRQQADVQTRSPFFYPFAFPANVLFAWREGLPVDRYDLLASEPRRRSLDLSFDRSSDRFLLEGWDAPGRDEWGDVWWTGSRRATLAVPMLLDNGRHVTVSVRARSRAEEPEGATMQAEVGVEVNGREIGRLIAPATAPSESSFTVSTLVVGRIFRVGYNRITFVTHGVTRQDPADMRPDGPMARSLGGRAWPVAIYQLRITSSE